MEDAAEYLKMGKSPVYKLVRGKEWEYRVIAVNKAGEGEPSNTVMAVL